MNYSEENQDSNNKQQVPIDVMYQELDKVYTISQVADIVGVEQSTVLFYYEKLNDFLKIASVGTFQLFSQTDVDNLSRIKHLDKDLNMSIEEIRQYLKINEQEILLERKVEQQISIDNISTLLNGLFTTINTQNNQINSIKDIILKTNDNVQSMIENQNLMQKEMQFMHKQLDDINKEMAITKELSDISSKYRELLQERNNIATKKHKNILKRLVDIIIKIN